MNQIDLHNCCSTYPIHFQKLLAYAGRDCYRCIFRTEDIRPAERGVEYAVDYIMYSPGHFQVDLFPLNWENSPSRYQNFLSRVTEYRVNVVKLVRTCYLTYLHEIVPRFPGATLMVRGAYTREEYRSGSNSGLSRKTKIYNYILTKQYDQEKVFLKNIPEHNVFYLCPCGYDPDFDKLLEAYERFQKEWEEEEKTSNGGC